ncbi:GH12459 [Drosophila grimshawi]|uniref:GH12459 n=1 Tax=Drosophila grimshawi TaxID=7222 RepID=B4JJB3_DROGR|nr:GH12459 [Drosophila grimshawi]
MFEGCEVSVWFDAKDKTYPYPNSFAVRRRLAPPRSQWAGNRQRRQQQQQQQQQQRAQNNGAAFAFCLALDDDAAGACCWCLLLLLPALSVAQFANAALTFNLTKGYMRRTRES